MSKLGISLISNALVKERKPVATKKSPKDKQKKLSKNNTRLINKTKSWKEIKR